MFVFKPSFICNLQCKNELQVFGVVMSSAGSHGLCHRSRRDGDRSSKRKRHHAEHAEPAASQHVPAGPVPASDARLKLDAADEVVSPSKRVRKEPAAVVKASPVFVLIATWHVQPQTVCGVFGAPCHPAPNVETTMAISFCRPAPNVEIAMATLCRGTRLYQCI